MTTDLHITKKGYWNPATINKSRRIPSRSLSIKKMLSQVLSKDAPGKALQTDLLVKLLKKRSSAMKNHTGHQSHHNHGRQHQYSVVSQLPSHQSSKSTKMTNPKNLRPNQPIFRHCSAAKIPRAPKNLLRSYYGAQNLKYLSGLKKALVAKNGGSSYSVAMNPVSQISRGSFVNSRGGFESQATKMNFFGDESFLVNADRFESMQVPEGKEGSGFEVAESQVVGPEDSKFLYKISKKKKSFNGFMSFKPEETQQSGESDPVGVSKNDLKTLKRAWYDLYHMPEKSKELRHSLDSNGLAYFEGVEILEKLDFQDFIKRLLKGFQTAIKALTSITETLQTKLEAKQADLLSQNRTSFPEFAQIYNTHTRETTLRPNSRIGSGTLPDRFASIESKPAGGLGFIKSSTKGKTTNNSSSQCYQYSPNSGEMGSREKVVVSDLTCFKEPGEDRDGHHIFLQNMSTQQSRHPHHHNGPGGPSLSHVGMSRRVRRSERTRSAQEMTAGGHLTVREQLGARNAGRRASTSFRVDEEEKRPRTGPQGHHVFDRKEELVENIKQLRKRIEEKDVDFIAKNWKQKLLLESRKNSSSIHSVHLHNGSRTFSEGSDGGPSSNKKLAGLVLDSKGEKYEKFGGAKQFNLHGEPSVVAPAGKNRGLHNLLCSFNIQEDSRHLTSTIDKFMYRTLEKSSILDYSDTKLMDSAGVKPRQLNTARSGREDSSKHNNGRNLIVEQEGMILEEDDEKVSHCFLVEPRKLIGGAQNLSKKFKNVGSRSSSMKRRRSSKADLELIERYLNGHGTQKMRFGPQNGQNVDHGTQVYIRQIEYQDEVSEGSSAQNSKILNQEHFRISDYEVSSMKKNKRRRNSKFEKSTQKSHKKRVNYVEEYRDEEKSENIPPEEDFLPQRRSKQPNFEPQSEDTRFQKKRSGKRLYVSKTRNEMPKGSFRSHLPHKNTRSRKSFTKRSQHSEPKKGNIYSCKQYSGPGVSSSQYSRTDSRSRKHSQAQNGQNTEKDQSSQYSIKMPLKSEQGYQTLQQNSQLTKTDHFNNAIKIQDRFLKTSARKAAHCSRSPKEISKVFLGSATSYQDPRGVNEAPGGLSSHRIPSSYSLKQGRGHKGYIEQNITKPIFRTLDGNGKSGKRRGDDSGTRSCLSKGNLSDFRHRNISGKKEEFDGDGSVDGANEGDSSPYHVSVSSRNGFVRKIKAKSVISKKSKKSAKKEKLSSRDSRSRSHKKLGSHRKLSGSKRTMMDSRKHKSCSRVKLEKETLNGPQTGTNLSKRASADKDSRLIPFGKPSLRQLSKKRVIEDNSVDVSKEASSGDSEGLDGYQDLKLDTEETRGVVYQSNRRPRKIKSVGYLSVRTADGGHLNTDHASEYDLERTLVPEKGGNNPGGSFIEIQSMYRKTEEASMNETKRMLY